jgi:hypothetical protein
VAAVVHQADQNAESLTLEHLELLDMEQEPAVAFEQPILPLMAAADDNVPAPSERPRRGPRSPCADPAPRVRRRAASAFAAHELKASISLRNLVPTIANLSANIRL